MSETTARGSSAHAHRWLPRLVAVAAVAVVGLTVGCGDDEESAPTTTAGSDLSDAVAIAQRGLVIDLTDTRVGAFITDLCAAAKSEGDGTSDGTAEPSLVEDAEGLPVDDSAGLTAALEALGDGAADLCADDVAGAPQLLNTLHAAAAPSFVVTIPAPAATDPPVTQAPVTAPPATSPPATSPPVTNPPATNPPATSPPGVYYANCDAARAAGAAPLHAGDPGYRSGLDRDNDGVACE
jgi:hypothetical protein